MIPISMLRSLTLGIELERGNYRQKHIRQYHNTILRMQYLLAQDCRRRNLSGQLEIILDIISEQFYFINQHVLRLWNRKE